MICCATLGEGFRPAQFTSEIARSEADPSNLVVEITEISVLRQSREEWRMPNSWSL
jgi:hypothetical protein